MKWSRAHVVSFMSSQFRVCILQRTRPCGESFRETLLTVNNSAIVKWDGIAFGAFPGCVTRCFKLTSRFLPHRPTKWRSTPCAVAIFSLSFFFFGRSKNLGICEATKDSSRASSKNREKKAAFVGCIWRSLQIWTAFVQRCYLMSL